MSDDNTTPEASDDVLIVPAPPGADPGTEDGVGECVLQGMGHDGVRRMDGEFGDLEYELLDAPSGTTPADGGAEPSTREG